MDLVRAMADYPNYHGYHETEDPSAPAQVPEADNPAGATVREASPEIAYAEVESLKQELALYQKELDAVYEQVASMRRESEAQAEAIRREGEAKAREIIRRATAEADLLEIRVRVRAEETRAQEVARLWSRLDSVLASSKEGGRLGNLEEAASAPPRGEKAEAAETVGIADRAAEPEAITAVAEGSAPVAEEAPSPEPDYALATPAAMEESVAGYVDQLPAQEDRAKPEGEPEAGVGSEEETSPEPDSGPAEAAAAGAESASDVAPQLSPEVRRYRVRGPLSFGSMVAIEQAAGRIPGVLSAKVSPSPDGGAVLTVSTHDSKGTELEIKQIPHLSWQLEEL